MALNDPETLNLELYNFLLQNRKTPNATTGLSPSSLLMKREKYGRSEGVVRNYNEKERKWKLAEILRKVGPMNYLLRVDGQIWKIHADQIKPSMPLTNENNPKAKIKRTGGSVITLPDNSTEDKEENIDLMIQIAFVMRTNLVLEILEIKSQ
ncbi:hypothetical protein JTB14_025825 [Gonioctena quinquepunctata]|nr:hypothetical protein JTB14_025825 [Gonioctena quinquepunctata]